ncbi:exonuclease [Pseudomonas phage Bertil]|uniref:Exonuclease n=1 Tax=Pseudomonas phage Bertil TaxID=2801385 RepID=A0A7T8EQK6_9CAUD|nr:exonuclease [Pseudomonas phage Bertil]QQO90893.1 exonuclease [Pseudomonas phage Strit]
MAVDLSRFGVKRSEVKNEFEGAVAGRTLIMDGDGPAYRAAATSARLDTAIRKYQTDMLTQMFLTQSQYLAVHLTASDCFKNQRGRVLASKPYQGNRSGKAKPSLLEPLRQAMAQPCNWLPDWNVYFHRDIEADDAMIIQSHQLKEDGVIWSDDKDLRLTPYLWWDQELGIIDGSYPVGYLQEKFTPAGHQKIVGRGIQFFWCQMLMGDEADNVKGIEKLDGKLCGKAAAYLALKDFKTEAELSNFVVSAYRAIGQNVLAEAWMLWLLRSPKDSAYLYLLDCGLTSANLQYVKECAKRHWFMRPNERRDYDKGKWTSEVYTV